VRNSHMLKKKAAETMAQHFSVLNTIISDLTQICGQKRLLMVIFSSLNKEKIDRCVDRLAVALEKFNVYISSLTSNA